MDKEKAWLTQQINNLEFDTFGCCHPSLDEDMIAGRDTTITKFGVADMSWLSDSHHIRNNPKLVFSGAKTAIVVGSNLGVYKNPHLPWKKSHKQEDLSRLRIARYAMSQKDYHIWMKKQLKKLCQLIKNQYDAEARPYVDTAPIAEKQLAVKAGLGWLGKHTNVVSPKFGSMLMLGVVLTEHHFSYDEKITPMCGNCNRCISACPTNAIDGKNGLNIPRCLSYLNIESKGEIDEAYHESMANKLFGCDDCIASCPYNRYTPPVKNVNNHIKVELTNIRVADLMEMNEKDFATIFRGSALKRTGYSRIMRNFKICHRNMEKNILQ